MPLNQIRLAAGTHLATPGTARILRAVVASVVFFIEGRLYPNLSTQDACGPQELNSDQEELFPRTQ